MNTFENNLAKITADFLTSVEAAILAAFKTPKAKVADLLEFPQPVKAKRKYTRRVKPVVEVPGPLAVLPSPVETAIPFAVLPPTVHVQYNQDPEDDFFVAVVDGKTYRASRARDVKRRIMRAGYIIASFERVIRSVTELDKAYFSDFSEVDPMPATPRFEEKAA